MQRKPGAPERGRLRGGRGRLSDYEVRLIEKQKLRAQYDIGERQLVNYYESARSRARAGEVTAGEALIQILESRLDAVVMRGGLATTIYAARQLVSHGHVQVNGRKVDLPAYSVRVGDVVSVKPESRDLPNVIESVEAWQPLPYLQLDKANRSVTLLRTPAREEVPVVCELPLVVEYYSR